MRIARITKTERLFFWTRSGSVWARHHLDCGCEFYHCAGAQIPGWDGVSDELICFECDETLRSLSSKFVKLARERFVDLKHRVRKFAYVPNMRDIKPGMPAYKREKVAEQIVGVIKKLSRETAVGAA